LSRTAIITTIVVAILALSTLALAGTAMSGEPSTSASPSPSPSASPTATPTPPASSATVKAALRSRAKARTARKSLVRVRRCFRASAPLRVVATPRRAASEAAWQKAQRRWKHQARDWRAKVKAGRAKMRDPGGSGWERWRPLVRWVWPAKCVETVIQIMRYESGGRPRVLCGGYVLPKGAGDGTPDPRAGGLMQCKPAPRHWADPEFNLEYAYHHKYVPAGGWSPWAGCLAFR